MTLMAFIEIIGISSIIPFLTVLGNPEMIKSNYYLSLVYTSLEFNSENLFLIFLGFIAFFVLLFSAALKSITSYAKYRFSNIRRHSIGQKLFSLYIKQPYSFFLIKNSSDISKLILSDTDIVIQQVILPFLNLIINVLITLSLVMFLIYVDPLLALILSSIFFIFYIVLFSSIRNYLSKIGEKRNKSNSIRFKMVSETMGGIKELKVLGRENNYFQRFKKPSYDFSHFNSSSQTLGEAPQYLVEVIAFGALLALAIYSIYSEQAEAGRLIPLLGIYALGAIKLKPAVNIIFRSLSSLKFGASIIDNIFDDIKNAEKVNYQKENLKDLSFDDELIIKNLDFSYSKNTDFILKNINLKIKARSMVGIIGATGSGKSTLVDILLGLLSPTNGEVKIDNVKLDETNTRSWQNIIGYVPQTIFLADDTIYKNIGFGLDDDEIKKDQIISAAKIAQLHDFINTLENKYDTVIGERGIRLSGGQRQRIGIARALYNNPEILILDEATSALDNITEKEVINAINKISGDKTIIMIAHRTSTLKNCDKIIKLKNGTVH